MKLSEYLDRKIEEVTFRKHFGERSYGKLLAYQDIKAALEKGEIEK